jgi:hypothetical protein
VINKIQKTKIVIALVAIAALTLAIVGFAAAQIAQNQPCANTTTDPNNTVPNSGFWGWIGNCFGLRTGQPYANQYVVPPVTINSSVSAPYQPYQGGYYGNGYGYGRSMGW